MNRNQVDALGCLFTIVQLVLVSIAIWVVVVWALVALAEGTL